MDRVLALLSEKDPTKASEHSSPGKGAILDKTTNINLFYPRAFLDNSFVVTTLNSLLKDVCPKATLDSFATPNSFWVVGHL
jgi:hypothetical protein